MDIMKRIFHTLFIIYQLTELGVPHNIYHQQLYTILGTFAWFPTKHGGKKIFCVRLFFRCTASLHPSKYNFQKVVSQLQIFPFFMLQHQPVSSLAIIIIKSNPSHICIHKEISQSIYSLVKLKCITAFCSYSYLAIFIKLTILITTQCQLAAQQLV